jgi:FHS family Na+ dependent glucose MFS transporter 1
MLNIIRYFASFIALGLITSSLGPTLPALAAQTGASISQISRLFIARSLGTMLGSLLIGRLYDRVGGHPLLGGSLIAAAIILVLMPLMPALWAIFVLFILLGLASASINVGGNALTAFVHGARVGPFINALHFTFSLGGTFAPLIIAQFAHRNDSLRLSYTVIAVLIIPAALVLWRVPSPIPFSRLPEHHNRPLPLFPVALFVIFLFLEIGGEASLMGWIFSYASARGMNTQQASDLNSAFWASFTLGRLGGILLALRIRPRLIIIPSLICWVLVTSIMLIAPPSDAILWFGTIGSGLAMAPIFPMTFALAQRRVALTGKVTGLFLVGSSVGGMFWPWLIGQLFNSTGPQSLMVIVLLNLIGGSALLAVIISRVLLRPRQGEPTAEDAI